MGDESETAVGKPINLELCVIHPAHPNVADLILEDIDADDAEPLEIRWDGLATKAVSSDDGSEPGVHSVSSSFVRSIHGGTSLSLIDFM